MAVRGAVGVGDGGAGPPPVWSPLFHNGAMVLAVITCIGVCLAPIILNVMGLRGTFSVSTMGAINLGCTFGLILSFGMAKMIYYKHSGHRLTLAQKRSIVSVASVAMVVLALCWVPAALGAADKLSKNAVCGIGIAMPFAYFLTLAALRCHRGCIARYRAFA